MMQNTESRKLQAEREAAAPGLPVGPDDARLSRPPCRDCGPGYRVGDEGCRHDGTLPKEGDTGICRTCAQPIWWEIGQIGGWARGPEWSDRVKRGGDSLVCFKAVGYRHVPMGEREEAIYRAGQKTGVQQVADLEALAERWEAVADWEDRPSPEVSLGYLSAAVELQQLIGERS